MKLTNDNAKKWFAALRSGEYKQGKKVLHRKVHDGPDEFCCLGVAESLFVKNVTVNPDGCVMYNKDYVLPSRVFWEDTFGISPATTAGQIDWPHELATPNGDMYVHVVSTCASINDSGEFTFSQIADIVEYFGILDLEGYRP